MKPILNSQEEDATDKMLKKARFDLDRAKYKLSSVRSKLELLLSQHETALANAQLRCEGHLPQDLRKVVQNGQTACIDGNVTALAMLVIEGANVVVLVSENRGSMERGLYKRLSTYEPDDLAMMKEWDCERAAVMILKEAISLQNKSIAASQRSAMVEFSRTVMAARAMVARKVLLALAAAQEATERDRHLAQELDPEEIRLLRPKPFPDRILNNEAVIWLLDSVAQGLIKPEELKELQLGSPAENPE